MSRIRILIDAGLPVLLRDLVVDGAGRRPDMEVVGQAAGAAMAGAVRHQQAGVVVVRMETAELPRVCRDLLRHFDDLVVVGISSDGRLGTVHRASLEAPGSSFFVPNVGLGQLLEMIHVASG